MTHCICYGVALSLLLFFFYGVPFPRLCGIEYDNVCIAEYAVEGVTFLCGYTQFLVLWFIIL